MIGYKGSTGYIFTFNDIPAKLDSWFLDRINNQLIDERGPKAFMSFLAPERASPPWTRTALAGPTSRSNPKRGSNHL